VVVAAPGGGVATGESRIARLSYPGLRAKKEGALEAESPFKTTPRRPY
jgi:hypothetical protein